MNSRYIVNFLKFIGVFTRVLSRAIVVVVSEGSKACACVLAPGTLGSTGDRALLEATTTQLRLAGYTQLRYFSYGEKVFPGEILKGVEILSLKNRLLSGNVLSLAYWRDTLKFLVRLQTAGLFVFLGADVIDGNYSVGRSMARLRLVSQASRLGRESCVISCSFNNNPPEEIKRFIARKCRKVLFSVRDPLSLERLRAFHQGASKLTADCAFLIEAQATTRAISVAEGIRRLPGTFVVGMNVSAPALEWDNGDLDRRLEALVREWLDFLTRAPSTVVALIPHDVRGGDRSDRALLCRFKTGLMQAGVEETRLIEIEDGLEPSEIKSIVGGLDACFSCRMHLAIACLGSCTPVLCLSYNDKFEGLFEHFSLEDSIIGTSMLETGYLLSGRLQSFMASAAGQREQIRKHLPVVMDLAQKNYSFSG